MDSHVKSINTDERSKKRIKFASQKQRAKRASADVYRSYRRKIGVTSAATREEFVHNPQGTERAQKRHRSSHSPLDDSNRTAIAKILNDDDEVSDDSGVEIDVSSTFAEELDVALDRNASEIFSKFHRQIWRLVRSLPEILHHSEKIIDLLLSHMLSPASLPERPSDSEDRESNSNRKEFIINHATTDILHLLTVLARDLRHEIHVYLHDKILPRIIEDLLNPPPPPPESGKQPIPLDVTIVEAAFRAMAYIFRYDSNVLEDQLESIRKYYGATLANRRDLVRRLAAETFAPLVRKIKSQSSRQRHLKRVLKALDTAEDQHATHRSKRIQLDAVDGISQLAFQIVRGVPGKLHSQGHQSLQFVFSFCTGKGSRSKKSSGGLIFSVASTLLDRLCRSMDDSNMISIAEKLMGLLKTSITAYSSEVERGNSSNFQPVVNSLKLLKQLSTFRSGSRSLLHQESRNLRDLFDSIQLLCSADVFSFVALDLRYEVVNHLCPLWKLLQSETGAASWLVKCLVELLKYDRKEDLEKVQLIQAVTEIISKDLLPHLTELSVLNAARRTILAAATSIAEDDPDAALLITFSVASRGVHKNDGDDDKSPGVLAEARSDDSLFFSTSGAWCKLSATEKESLISCCLVSLPGEKSTRNFIAKVIVALRCAPFVMLLSRDTETEEEAKKYYEMTSTWVLGVLNRLEDASSDKSVDDKLKPSVVIAKAVALEALANLSLEYLNFSGKSSVIEKAVLRAKPMAELLILSDSGSLWAIRGVASLTRVLAKLSIRLDNELDQVFDALVPNLRSKCHSLRLNTLEILITYPEKYFVSDHTDLDFDGDLDEDPSFRPPEASASKRGPTCPCDILKAMHRLESIPVKLANERSFVAAISRIEVLGRTGKLPVVYVEAAANHMLGSFYVKFAPIWPVATRCLTLLLKTYEDAVWPAIEATLMSSMERPPIRGKVTLEEDAASDIITFEDHLIACGKWESSDGLNASIFGQSEFSLKDDEVPSFNMTDEDTVTESIWGVAEQSQQTVAKNSRLIVPAFIRFLHNQYYAFHQNDPDARELALQEHVSSDQRETYEDIEKAVVYKRLLCFLRVFAVLDGPKQLVHHQLLEKVYRSFLSHQDDEVAQLALSCLLKYKTQYLLPYSSFLNEILKKGQLREALLNFAEKFKAGDVAELHREALLPLISRILFGRLSVKGKRSSKDSPVARRAAILSFLSVVCKDESEIFPFVYLMTRHFLPRKQRLIPIEAASQNDRQNAMDLLMSIGLEDLAVLPSGVIEGFLHLLETVVSQLGHRIISFVPQFTSIVLALCTMAADGRNKEARVEDGTDASTRGLVYRYSSIRSLGYQQLSEIFGRFCMTVDFSSFARPTWRALDRSVELLPEMVMKTEKAPAILVLLETMSTDWRLIKILAMHDAAVQSVVKCIAGTSLVSVMNSSLTFVENLLTVRDPTSSSESKTTGLRLIRKYIPLLMEQFTLRLKNGSDYDGDKGPAKGKHWSKPGHPHTTWRRELDILCRVSELLSNEDGDRLKDKSSVLASLFSLLLPFLKPDRMTSDDDKLNIVGILKSTMPQLEKENMAEIFASISGILAPSKGKPGIKSRLIRHAIASLVGAIAKVDGQFRLIADKLVKLNAMHAKRVDEMDFEVVIPALNSLSQSGGDGTWLSLCGEDDPSPSILNPLISTCFHFLHNDDGVILRVSFNALRTLIRLAAEKATDDTASVWAKLVESAVVPLTRSGLQSRDPSVRRHYILLVKEISRSFQTHSSPNLCGDLHTLIDDENPDLDFFMNITHVQIHRRSRAFQRLRKVLSEAVNETNVSPFCLQSLSNVLLPIAMHPIYECRTIAEETFALEAIATVGSISRLLSWSKYNNMLWTMLTHFERYPEQERFLIGAICAVIDGFGYELTVSDGDDKQITKDEGGDDDTKTAVWRSLERRMIPKIEGLLTKETTDRSGSRKKTIRPTIILALLKLFQKFPEHFFESKLPHLLSVICDALRSKDSNARDVARKTMAKMVVSMDLKYLADVLREVAITLTEGYRLHVRAAVVHTVLQELSNSYKPSSVDSSTPLYFDDCTAALMELIQEDLFGEANERRESKETNVRFVKEAGGSKSLDSIELICRMVNFKPLDAGNNGPNRSSVHCVVSPLLERLRSPDVETATIRKIRLILTRVVVGLSHNSSVRADQLFPFVYATVEPFIGAQAIAAAQNSRNDDDDDDDDMDDALRPIQISGARDAKKGKEAPRKGKVVEWRPSTLKAAESSKAALESKRDEKNELRKVRDGASAPKLTGSSRHDTSNMSSHQGLNDLGSISAVVFGLNLLNSCLKKLDLVDKSLPAMMDPFVPLLTACVCFCRESDVALVGLKCLMSFLRFDLPSIPSCSESLGTQALAFLTSSGSSLNQNPDLTQACFRTLTYLIKSDEGAGVGGNKDKNILVDGEHVLTKNSKMPLNAEQMKVLISTLQLSVAESDQHNPALGLIKAILARRYTSPELYDLMEAMLKLVVRSHTAALRQQSSTVFVRYLLDYPMGEERFGKHMKQIIANISYEYKDGRMSAINLFYAVIEKLPEELLGKHTQLFFIPLVLQMVNDESNKCRDAVIKCLERLLSRSSTEMLQATHGYIVKWSKQHGPLRVASLQVLGIFADVRSDFIQQSNLLLDWLQSLQTNLNEKSSEWEISYFSLLCVEKFSKNFEVDLSKADDLWKGIVECLVDTHPWVRLASCRVLHKFFVASGLHKILHASPGMLFEIVRNLCFQMNAGEEEFSQELSEFCIKTLTLVLPIMNESPHLCFAKDQEQDGRNPVPWLVQRLSQIAKAKGSKRRIAVFKCFAAFTTQHTEIVSPHLALMLEPLHRSSVEARNELENPYLSQKREVGSEEVISESNLATEVLQVIEETATSSESFLKALGSVKNKARDKKEQRKLEIKLEAANDPQAAAERKIKKQVRERQRKKRRVQDRRHDRGAVKKRRSVF